MKGLQRGGLSQQGSDLQEGMLAELCWDLEPETNPAGAQDLAAKHAMEGCSHESQWATCMIQLGLN